MENFKENEFKLFRCQFLREGKNYIKAVDFNGKYYIIKKSPETRNFKEGFDDEFYARLEVKGVFNKKILHVISFEEYLALKN